MAEINWRRWASGWPTGLKSVVHDLTSKVEDLLEGGGDSGGGASFYGGFQPGVLYPRGAMVLHGNALWYCVEEHTPPTEATEPGAEFRFIANANPGA